MSKRRQLLFILVSLLVVLTCQNCEKFQSIQGGLPAATAVTTSSTTTSGTTSSASVTPTPSSICTAIDATSLKTCVAQANTGLTTTIVIQGMINCGSSDNCAFSFNSLKGALTIQGANSSSGVTRTAGYSNGDLFTFNTIVGALILQNLTFDDSANQAQLQSGAPSINTACGGVCPAVNLVSLMHLKHVLIQNVQFLNGKNMGLALNGDVSEIFIRSCSFESNWIHGFWSQGDDTNRGIHIENNYFLNNRSNGIMFAATGPDSGDPLGINSISGNHFQHNHYAAAYWSCNGPCGGGQLDLEQHSAYVSVENNYFEDGHLDEDPSISSSVSVAGVELAPSNVYEVMIFNNYFRDMSSNAVSIDGTDIAAIQVINNIFDGTGSPAISNAGVLSSNSGNCNLGNGCGPWHSPSGQISSDVNPCSLQGGQCTENISWSSSNSQENLSVFLNQQYLFAQSDNSGNSQAASWISTNASTFDLYSGTTWIGSLVATGQ